MGSCSPTPRHVYTTCPESCLQGCCTRCGLPSHGPHRACSWSSEFCLLSPRAEPQCGQVVAGYCLSTDTVATWTTQSHTEEFNQVGNRSSGYRAAAGGDREGRGPSQQPLPRKTPGLGPQERQPLHSSLPLPTNKPDTQLLSRRPTADAGFEIRNRSVQLQRCKPESPALPGSATRSISLDRRDKPPLPPPASQLCPGQTWTAGARSTEQHGARGAPPFPSLTAKVTSPLF